MDFIKKMKKREYIEFGLKALAGLLLAFVAIILMEGMIYSINLNAYMKKSTTAVSSSAIAYCIKDGENEKGEDLYFVLYHSKAVNEQGEEYRYWCSVASERYTEDMIKSNNSIEKIVWHAPSAFDFTITPVHYVVMAVFVAGVAGYFVWRFIKLSKSYKEIEATYEKTGAIEISNI